MLERTHAEAEQAETIGGPAAAILLGVALVVFVAIYGLIWNQAWACGLDLGALAWWTILAVGSAWLLPEGSFAPFWPLVFRLATTALGWRIPSPVVAVLLVDLGTLPAITIIAAGAYGQLASLSPLQSLQRTWLT